MSKNIEIDYNWFETMVSNNEWLSARPNLTHINIEIKLSF